MRERSSAGGPGPAPAAAPPSRPGRPPGPRRGRLRAPRRALRVPARLRPAVGLAPSPPVGLTWTPLPDAPGEAGHPAGICPSSAPMKRGTWLAPSGAQEEPAMTRRRLDDERAPEDYAGDQPQGPGPDNDDRIPRRIRRGEGPAPTVAAH